MKRDDNQLMALLPRKDRVRLLSLGRIVQLPFGEVLWSQGETVRNVYFPQTAFVSLIASLDGKPVLEVGMAGNEGLLGVQLVLGMKKAPLHALVQGAGSALRIGGAAFLSEVGSCTALRRVLDHYTHVLMSQLCTSAACVRFHLVGPRLARWLLMTQDRARAERFHVTQEFLSYMLGVRRVSITSAAGVLQRDGLIAYHRGEISVLDRRGLEKASCSCYSTDRHAYSDALH